jgi:hypothetical protein
MSIYIFFLNLLSIVIYYSKYLIEKIFTNKKKYSLQILIFNIFFHGYSFFWILL